MHREARFHEGCRIRRVANPFGERALNRLPKKKMKEGRKIFLEEEGTDGDLSGSCLRAPAILPTGMVGIPASRKKHGAGESLPGQAATSARYVPPLPFYLFIYL